MEGGSSPSRHWEKRSKKNQDRVAVPKPPGHTKASYKRGGPAGSHASRGHDDQGSSTAVPPPTPAFVGDMSIVDEEEEELERAGRTIATPPIRTPTHGLAGVSACFVHWCVADHVGAHHGSQFCWWLDSSSPS